MFVYPYKKGSTSAKALRTGLDAKLIKLENSKFKGGENKIVVNWGSSEMPQEVLKCKVLNNPEAVKIASDKLKFFNTVKEDVNIPEYTTDKNVAEEWIKKGKVVFLRTELRGRGGTGIYIIDNKEEWDEFNHSIVKLYVLYVPKRDEYRVHIIGDEVADVQRKALRNDYDRNMVNFKVRNHDNGFIFMREGVDPPDEVITQAVLAVKRCGLDFGAVDIIWNNYRKKAYVLEVNTAPGLEGQTVENYINGLTNLFAGHIPNDQETVDIEGDNPFPNTRDLREIFAEAVRTMDHDEPEEVDDVDLEEIIDQQF